MAYPTDRTLYWRLDSTSGTQDGTVDTAGNSGTAAFESLAALIAYVVSTDADLTGQGPLTLITTQTGRETPSLALDFSGITTTASDYLVVEAQGDARNNGVSYENDANCYQVQRAGYAWQGGTGYYRVKGIEMSGTSSSGYGAFDEIPTHGAGSSDIRFDECLFTCTSATALSNYCVHANGSITFTFTNCLVLANGHRAADMRSSTTTVDHCGFITANTYAAMVDTGVTVTNSYAISSAAGGEDWYQAANGSSTNNASLDNSCDPSTNAVDIVASTNEFNGYTAVPSTADLTLKDSLLNEAGTGSEAVDITGSARTGTADIGPFNFAAAGGGLSIPVAYHHYNRNLQ